MQTVLWRRLNYLISKDVVHLTDHIHFDNNCMNLFISFILYYSVVVEFTRSYVSKFRSLLRPCGTPVPLRQ